MVKAVLAAWLCIAALALLTVLLAAMTSLDPVVLGITVSVCAMPTLYIIDRRRVSAREMTSEQDESS